MVKTHQATSGDSATRSRSKWGIVVLCAFLILGDGYDLVVYGNVVPSLLAEPGWNLTPQGAGLIGSLVLVGMLFGALGAGILADRIGRRRVVIISVTWFSAAMALCALAPSPILFGVFRAIAGLGLGALFPVVTALILEFAPQNRKAMVYSFTLFGYLAGGILAGALGLVLIPALGWRSMFWVGAFPLFLIPLVVWALPESPAWLAARGQVERAREIGMRFDVEIIDSATEKPKPGAIFRHGLAVPTLLAWAIQFCSLLLVFGMVNWLPTIMVSLGYNIRSALLFAVVLNVGAAVGALIGSRIVDRGPLVGVVVTLFALGASAILMLSVTSPTVVMFGLVAIAGAGTLGTQILVNVLVGSLYPTVIRATGLGWSLAVGRLGGILGPLIGGGIIGAGFAPYVSFYVFAIVGAIGAVLAIVLLINRRLRGSAQPVNEHV